MKLYISAPFGNYLHFPGCISTLGTYTVAKRGNVFTRLWRAATTIRRRHGGWVNRMGLANPGIWDAPYARKDRIISLKGFDVSDWILLMFQAEHKGYRTVEFNLSCPNVDGSGALDQLDDALGWAKEAGISVIAKLGPLGPIYPGRRLFDLGVRKFHLCNTLPVPEGGLGGKPLMSHSLRAVREFRKEFGDSVELIGGGGVTSADDVKEYLDAGADDVSIGSMLFDPFAWRKVRGLLTLPS